MVSKLKSTLIIICIVLLGGAWPSSGLYPPTPNGSMSVTYVGPGDVVTGAKFWLGLRAYNNTVASAGSTTTPVIDVLGNSTVTGCTIYLAGDHTGNLDFTTAGAGGVGNQCLLGATTFCTVTNTTCSISKLYDQSGALFCVGSTRCDFINGTAANQPTLIFNCIGSFPCLSFNGISSTVNINNNGLSNPAQPYTLSTVVEFNTAGVSGSVFDSGSFDQANEPFLGHNISAQLVTNHSGVFEALSMSVTANNFHAIQGIYNGASSIGYHDGTTSTGTLGPDALTLHNVNTVIGSNQFNTHLTGSISEFGAWATGFSGAQQTSMNSNQHTYWGF